MLLTILSSGRKPEEEGVEDNGLEENSGDGQVFAALPVSLLGGWTPWVHPLTGMCVLSQEDVETSLENLQDIDMMDISVLDEAEIDNGSVADCVEDDDADNLPESLSDSRELEGEMKELPEQLPERAVGARQSPRVPWMCRSLRYHNGQVLYLQLSSSFSASSAG